MCWRAWRDLQEADPPDDDLSPIAKTTGTLQAPNFGIALPIGRNAGIRTIDNGQLVRRRAEGKLVIMVRELASEPAPGGASGENVKRDQISAARSANG